MINLLDVWDSDSLLSVVLLRFSVLEISQVGLL